VDFKSSQYWGGGDLVEEGQGVGTLEDQMVVVGATRHKKG